MYVVELSGRCSLRCALLAVFLPSHPSPRRHIGREGATVFTTRSLPIQQEARGESPLCLYTPPSRRQNTHTQRRPHLSHTCIRPPTHSVLILGTPTPFSALISAPCAAKSPLGLREATAKTSYLLFGFSARGTDGFGRHRSCVCALSTTTACFPIMRGDRQMCA
jgi:hypothetical protein